MFHFHEGEALGKGSNFEYQLLFPHWQRINFLCFKRDHNVAKNEGVFLHLTKTWKKSILCEKKVEFDF